MDASLKWCSTPPLWHTKAVGGRPPHQNRAALFETLYASGMRISEALSLPSDAAPPGTRMLLVRDKGDKQRLVPLHARAIEALAQWQRLARAYSGGAPSPWLFHSVRNGSKALTRHTALLEIKEAAVVTGLPNPERVSPHVLRHAFATHKHSGGTDLRVLQERIRIAIAAPSDPVPVF